MHDGTVTYSVWLERLREELLANSFLFDEPEVYTAGVEDALAEVSARIAEEPPRARVVRSAS